MSIARSACRALLVCLLAASAGRGVARAEELPARHQALLLLRVLAYDRNVKSRVGGAVTVAILSRADDPGSRARAGEVGAAFETVGRDVVVAGLLVRVEQVVYRGLADLEARLTAIRPALVYLDAALVPQAVEIQAATRRHRVLSASGSRTSVEGGTAVAVVARGDRAAIVVNLRAAREEGADLDAALLSVADVLRD